MAERRERLKRADFEAVSHTADTKRLASTHFSIVFIRKTEKSGSAIVISKKIEKSAVKRHLLKRRVSEVIRAVDVPEGSLIVYAREGSSALSFTELSGELHTLLNRLTHPTPIS